MGQLPLVLVCWGLGLPGLFGPGYRCRIRFWLEELHGAQRCSEPCNLGPLPGYLVQGQSVRHVQGGSLRSSLCWHNHRYQHCKHEDFTLSFASFFSCWTQWMTVPAVFPCGLSKWQMLQRKSVWTIWFIFVTQDFLLLLEDKKEMRADESWWRSSAAINMCCAG